ncbi:MAG: hypothetical protein ACTHMI_10275 [Mucilaginibacter sp.]
MKSFALFPLLLILFSLNCRAQKRINAKDAANHKGETLMVCDKVFNTEVARTGNTTLLYVGSEDGRYLTVLVKGPDHPKFNWHPERDFKGRTICVSGKIVDYNGRPAIYVTDPSQLKPGNG